MKLSDYLYAQLDNDNWRTLIPYCEMDEIDFNRGRYGRVFAERISDNLRETITHYTDEIDDDLEPAQAKLKLQEWITEDYSHTAVIPQDKGDVYRTFADIGAYNLDQHSPELEWRFEPAMEETLNGCHQMDAYSQVVTILEHVAYETLMRLCAALNDDWEEERAVCGCRTEVIQDSNGHEFGCEL